MCALNTRATRATDGGTVAIVQAQVNSQGVRNSTGGRVKTVTTEQWQSRSGHPAGDG